MLFRLFSLCDFYAIWAQKQFLASKSGQNRPKRENPALFLHFAKMASKTPKKALARATFLAHARFERFGAKRAEKCDLGRESAQKRPFAHFLGKIAKSALLE